MVRMMPNSRDTIGIENHGLVSHSQRIASNNWITDVYGRVLAFSDIGLDEITALEQNVHQFGALLLISEYEGTGLHLGKAGAAQHIPHEDDKLIIGQLASLDPEDGRIPASLLDETQVHLRALFRASTSIIPGAVLFGGYAILAKERYDRMSLEGDQRLTATVVHKSQLMITAARMAVAAGYDPQPLS